jgi:transportin-1
MSQQWQPHPQALEQLIAMFRSTLGGGSAEVQREAHAQLQSYRQLPDFCNYLAFVFAKRTDLAEELRFAAAMLLKNLLQHKEYYDHLSNEVKNYVRNEIVTVLGDEKESMRRACANVISAICLARGLAEWPDLIDFLLRCLDSSDLRLIDSAFMTLRNICEDCGEEMNDRNVGKPVNKLVPKCIQFLRSPHESHRVYALECLIQIISHLPTILVTNIDEFVQNLFLLANDIAVPVRLRLCRTFATLVWKDCSYIEKWLKHLVDFMLICTQDKNPSIVMEACEFWTALSDHEDTCYQVVRPVLDKLVPILLKGLVYSEEELISLRRGEQDADIPDSENDIRPLFHADIASTKGIKLPQQTTSNDEQENSDEEFEDADAEDDQNQQDSPQWSVRKASGQALDSLAYVFRGELLFTLLPQIEAMIKDENWLYREAAVLALGAVANGAFDDMLHYLPNVIPYLINLLRDQHFLIRTITVWSLGRYGYLLMRKTQDEKCLQILLQNILLLTLDNSKKVQEAAMSALASLEDGLKETNIDLAPYIDPIVSVFAQAFSKYQIRNKLILWDAIATLAEAAGSLLNQPKYVEVILPPLMQSLNELRDDDHRLFPLLSAISVLANTLGIGFQKYASPVYSRCVRIIERTLVSVEMARQNPDIEKPNKDFIVAALDVLISLAEGLQTGFESLIANSNLIGMIVPLAKDPYFQIQQSIFALIGELAQWAMVHIRPLLNELIPYMVTVIHEQQYLIVINNSIWALGEMAVQLQHNFKDAVVPLLERLIPIINQEGVAPNLVENVSVCIGRLALVCPDDVAPHFPKFVRNWLKGLRSVHNERERESAFRGLVRLLERRPQDVLAVEDFHNLCQAIASWKRPPQEMKNVFFNVLHTYKNVIIGPQQWSPVYSQFSDELRQQLKEMYQID